MECGISILKVRVDILAVNRRKGYRDQNQIVMNSVQSDSTMKEITIQTFYLLISMFSALFVPQFFVLSMACFKRDYVLSFTKTRTNVLDDMKSTIIYIMFYTNVTNVIRDGAYYYKKNFG